MVELCNEANGQLINTTLTFAELSRNPLQPWWTRG